MYFDKKSLVKKLDNENIVRQPPTPELPPLKQNQESAEDETLRRNFQGRAKLWSITPAHSPENSP